jgi:hypothetical protein
MHSTTDVPEALAARMRLALAGVAMPSLVGSTSSDSARLALAARVCLQDALAACDERDAALPLLAADALITAACEHADEGELRRLAADWAPERLAATLPS